jgi:hypothetical protein
MAHSFVVVLIWLVVCEEGRRARCELRQLYGRMENRHLDENNQDKQSTPKLLPMLLLRLAPFIFYGHEALRMSIA